MARDGPTDRPPLLPFFEGDKNGGDHFELETPTDYRLQSILTERERVAHAHRREGGRPSAALVASQVAPEPALQ